MVSNHAIAQLHSGVCLLRKEHSGQSSVLQQGGCTPLEGCASEWHAGGKHYLRNILKQHIYLLLLRHIQLLCFGGHGLPHHDQAAIHTSHGRVQGLLLKGGMWSLPRVALTTIADSSSAGISKLLSTCSLKKSSGSDFNFLTIWVPRAGSLSAVAHKTSRHHQQHFLSSRMLPHPLVLH